MMKLSSKEREIIVAAQFLADVSIREIQKITGFQEHTIRYTLDKALSSGLIQKRCFLNLDLLGYSQFQVYFTPISEKKNYRAELLSELGKNDKVSWAGELGGEFHFGLNLCVRDVVEVADFLEQIATKTKIRFLDKLIAARIKLSHFGYGFLSPETVPGKPLQYQATNKRIEIDKTDHLILQELVRPNFLSKREISRTINLPFSTLEYRLKKLETQGVIQGYYYMLNAEALGYQSFMVQLRIKDASQAKKKSLYNFCKEHPAAVVYIESIGAWDIEIYFNVMEARDIVLITQQLHERFTSMIQSLKVIPVLSYHKLQEYPFREFKMPSYLSSKR